MSVLPFIVSYIRVGSASFVQTSVQLLSLIGNWDFFYVYKNETHAHEHREIINSFLKINFKIVATGCHAYRETHSNTCDARTYDDAQTLFKQKRN